MAYNARVLADSVNPCGNRLTTLEVTLPRIILAELNTHRMFSRNSASSRAIPIEKMIARVLEDPFVPIYWGKSQKGMAADEEVSEDEQHRARGHWLLGRDDAVYRAHQLIAVGVHKQIVNRLLEPWLWQTCIITATDWGNAFALRRHPAAQPEIRRAFDMMWDVMQASEPGMLSADQWHLPLVRHIDEQTLLNDGYLLNELAHISAGRCARVSYLTHDGKRDPDADLELAHKLVSNGHMSPLEHSACALMTSERMGNFAGWKQLRKTIVGEAGFTG